MAEDSKVKAIAVFFEDKFGNQSYVRTYSFVDHGKNFVDLAKEFKATEEAEGKKVVLKEQKD